MTSVSNRRLARGFVKQLHSGQSPKRLVSQLAAIIVEQKKVNETDLILNDISGEFEKQMSTTNAVVYSVHELNSSIRVEVAKLIKQTSKTDKVILNEKIEPSLLGGVRIETPESEIDLSIKNKLKSLEASK